MCCVCAACELRGVLALLEMIKGGVERERERYRESTVHTTSAHMVVVLAHSLVTILIIGACY